MFVELHRAPDYPAVLLEMIVPIRVGEHDKGSAVGAALVRCVNKPPKIRLNAQRIEVVSADLKRPCQGWIFTRVQPYLSDVTGDQILEAAVTLPQVQVIGIRLTRVRIVSDYPPYSIQALRLWHIQLAQDQPI